MALLAAVPKVNAAMFALYHRDVHGGDGQMIDVLANAQDRDLGDGFVGDVGASVSVALFGLFGTWSLIVPPQRAAAAPWPRRSSWSPPPCAP